MNIEGEIEDGAKKVNGTDAQKTAIVQPTYKKLDDPDSNWKPKEELIEMSKQNGTEADIDDGAQEKMLKEDNKAVVAPAKNATEQVKFVSANGETKIDVDIVKPVLSGMGKEELMKFANDPFWVRLRWFLFTLFWVLWVGMLAGAITIIIFAPKCVPPEPKKFWEESVIIDLDFEDTETKNFDGLTKIIDGLVEHNIKTISLPSIFAESAPGQVTNFTDINKKYGTLEDFKKFVAATKERNQHIVLEFNPHYTGLNHNWFNKSVYKEDGFADFYIWSNRSMESDNEPTSLNEIMEKRAYNNIRKAYYSHNSISNKQPLLNFSNKNVVDAIKDVFRYWINLGVSGFRLNGNHYLIKNEKSEDQTEKNVGLFKEFRQAILNMTDQQGLLALEDPLGNDVVRLFKQENAIDLSYTTQITQAVSDKKLNSKDFGDKVSTLLKDDSEWPSWDLKRFAKKMNTEEAENVMLFTMLLPGTPVVRLEDINNNTNKMFDELSKARSDQTFQYGDYAMSILHNNTVVAYTRIKSGNPGFLIAFYDGPEATKVDFSSMEFIPDELKILAFSSNYVQNGTTVASKFFSNEVLLQPQATLAMKFVPKLK